MLSLRLVLCGIALFVATISSHSATAEATRRESFEPWTLSYDVLSDGKGYCRLGRTWPAGLFMEFVSFGPSQPPVMSVVNPMWNLDEKAGATIVFEVDGTPGRTLSFQRLSPHQAIDSGADKNVDWALDRFATAKRMVAVFSGGDRYSLDVASGSAARLKFNDCARTWAGQAVAASQTTSSGPAVRPPATGGTGFAYGRDGTVITNAHVIAGCQAIVATTAGRSLPARIVAQDRTSDLAAIRVDGIAFDRVAALGAPEKTAVGEKAITYGFPLYGALSSDGNFAIGYVSALAGLHDDSRFLQISTPLQPGNSGGPLLDDAGNLIGIVAAKLDAMKMEQVAGSLPENVNFAIKAQTLVTFLQANNIPLNPPNSGEPKSDVELAALGRALAVRISCGG